MSAAIGCDSPACNDTLQAAKGGEDPETNDPEKLSSTGAAVASSVLLVIGIFGIINNLLVIVVFARNRQIRTPMNLILLNLSISDLGISLLGSPITFLAAVHGRWPFGDVVCHIYGFLMCLTGMNAIGTLAAIALERYIIIVRTMGNYTFTMNQAMMMIASIWFYAIMLSAPPLFGWSNYVIEKPGIACSVDWETSTLNNSSYIIYLFLLGYFIPLFIMAFCYGQVIVSIRRAPRVAGKSNVLRAEHRVNIMVAFMITCTLIAWTPYAIVSLISTMGYAHLIGTTAAAAPAIFAKSSVLYNPVVYFFTNPQIRGAILAFLGCTVLDTRTRTRTQQISMSTFNVNTTAETVRVPTPEKESGST